MGRNSVGGVAVVCCDLSRIMVARRARRLLMTLDSPKMLGRMVRCSYTVISWV